MDAQCTLFEKLEKIHAENQKVNHSPMPLIDRISKKGLLEKSKYALPLKDTLGKTLHSHFNSFGQ